MNPEEALQLVLDKLEDCGIDYMLTGSFASNMHGVPRTTYDADIVIEIETSVLDGLVRSFGGLRRSIGATGSCPWGST